MTNHYIAFIFILNCQFLYPVSRIFLGSEERSFCTQFIFYYEKYSIWSDVPNVFFGNTDTQEVSFTGIHRATLPELALQAWSGTANANYSQSGHFTSTHKPVMVVSILQRLTDLLGVNIDGPHRNHVWRTQTVNNLVTLMKFTWRPMST